jgi:WhiB family redox-sensing transcriptional regulator
MDLTWRKSGACNGLEASVFYPATEEDAEVAKAICELCAVQKRCRDYALEGREKDGVWGGLTERERRRILRSRRQSA